MEKFITIRGLYFKCDEEGNIFRNIGSNCWKKIGGKCSGGYIGCNTSEGLIKSHRIIAAAFLGLDIEDKTMIVDHINGIKDDNRVCNLRVVNHTQNCMNYHNKEVKGINQNEWGNWRAYINHNKARYSKTFKTLEEAKEWRQAKEIEFGYLHTTCV